MNRLKLMRKPPPDRKQAGGNIADNGLKQITVYKTPGDEDKAAATKTDGNIISRNL